jgi:hypothetical protein
MASTADQIIRVLLQQARCTDCDCAYRVEDVHVLRQSNERVWDLAAVCHRCYTMSLIRAVVQAPGSRALPSIRARGLAISVATELTMAERKRFACLSPVGSDDVLDLHDFLEDFDGDFRGLFGRDGDEP